MRLTVRTLMIAIAALTVFAAMAREGLRLRDRSREYSRMAEIHRLEEQYARSSGDTSRAEEFATQRRKYEDAAWHPWESNPADLPMSVLEAKNSHSAGDPSFNPRLDYVETMEITAEVIPKPDGLPYADGDQIHCRGTIVWTGASTPRSVIVRLRPGLWPEAHFATWGEAFGTVRVLNEAPDGRSGTAEWQATVRANRNGQIEDYIIQAYPFGKRMEWYIKDKQDVYGFTRLKITR